MDELLRLKDELIRALQNENESLKHRNEDFGDYAKRVAAHRLKC